MKDFTGMGVALVTPFTDDNHVDYGALEELVEFQIQNGTDYLVVLGTTGETPVLSTQEQEAIVNTVIRVNEGRLPIVVGVGSNNTAALVKKLGSMSFEGVDAVLSVTPYYNKPTQEGLYRHFMTVADASPVPVILYNVPHRTGVNMLPETVIRLANDCENIIAVKEASGNMAQVLELLAGKPDDFHVISGDDNLALSVVLAGGSGVISVIGQGLPEMFSKMIRLGLEGRSKEAFKLFYETLPLIGLIFREGNPAGIKSVLSLQGIGSRKVRLPLIESSDDLHEKIRKFVVRLNQENYVIKKNRESAQ